MTDDITRGLAALADEAQPAPIDSHTVVQLAHAHTRARRAVVASAFATIVAAGALVVAFTTVGGTSGDGDVAAPPTISTTPTPNRVDDYRPATPEENAERKPRLRAELVAAFDAILPDDWQHSTFGFGCDQTGCFAEGDLIDEHGAMPVHLYTSTVDNFGEFSCNVAECTHTSLDDGTAVSFRRTTGEGWHGDGPQVEVSVSATRPDGTVFSMSVRWPEDRPAPALTDEQWMEFGRALTY